LEGNYLLRIDNKSTVIAGLTFEPLTGNSLFEESTAMGSQRMEEDGIPSRSGGPNCGPFTEILISDNISHIRLELTARRLEVKQ